MPSAKLIEKRKEFEVKQRKIMKAFEEAGDGHDFMKSTELTGKDQKERVEEIKRLNKELQDLGQELAGMVALENMEAEAKERQRLLEKSAPAGLPLPEGRQGQILSVGKQFTESPIFKAAGSRAHVPQVLVGADMDLKTLMTTAAGFAPESIRTGEVVPYVRRPTRLLDLVPMGPTTQAAVVYMEQTTRTNNAAEATEGTGAFGEAAIAYTERSQTVQLIATILPVTMQQLEDVPQIESLINNELMSMVRERLDYQIANGNGTPPNLAGLLYTGLQTFARGGTEHFDALATMVKNIQVTGRATAGALVVNPSDWWSSKLRLKRTTEGLYILGNPSEPGPDRLWGMMVVPTDAIAQNTVLGGDFATWCRLYEKRGILLEISDSHDTYFAYGKLAIRATGRWAMVRTRAAAFHSITEF